MPAEASSSCPSDAKREATNANARYGVDDPFDRERPPPTERRTKETSSNDDSKAALALGRPSHDGTLCPARDKKVCDDDSKEEETFARSMMMNDDFDEIPIHTHRRRVCSALSSAREWPSRRLWSCLASSSPRLFQALCRHRCRQRRRPKMPCLSLSLSSMKMDSMDEKKVKKKKKKKKNS